MLLIVTFASLRYRGLLLIVNDSEWLKPWYVELWYCFAWFTRWRYYFKQKLP